MFITLFIILSQSKPLIDKNITGVIVINLDSDFYISNCYFFDMTDLRGSSTVIISSGNAQKALSIYDSTFFNINGGSIFQLTMHDLTSFDFSHLCFSMISNDIDYVICNKELNSKNTSTIEYLSAFDCDSLGTTFNLGSINAGYDLKFKNNNFTLCINNHKDGISVVYLDNFKFDISDCTIYSSESKSSLLYVSECQEGSIIRRCNFHLSKALNGYIYCKSGEISITSITFYNNSGSILIYSVSTIIEINNIFRSDNSGIVSLVGQTFDDSIYGSYEKSYPIYHYSARGICLANTPLPISATAKFFNKYIKSRRFFPYLS